MTPPGLNLVSVRAIGGLCLYRRGSERVASAAIFS